MDVKSEQWKMIGGNMALTQVKLVVINYVNVLCVIATVTNLFVKMCVNENI